MSQSIQTQAQLLALFADGQAIGSITPEFARDLIVSVGSQALINQAAPVYDLGSIGASLTLLQSNGGVQVGTLTLGTACAVTVTGETLGDNWFCAMNVYIVNNTSGTGTLTWPENVTWVGANPQPIPQASIATKFRLESLDGGDNWSILTAG